MANKATLDEVREFIRFASKVELETISSVIQSRWKHLQAELSFNFTRGDKVYFIKGKRDPRRITGEVVHSDGKWVYIKADHLPAGLSGWNWKVAPSLLRKQQ
jgi:hypothetical protein